MSSKTTLLLTPLFALCHPLATLVTLVVERHPMAWPMLIAMIQDPWPPALRQEHSCAVASSLISPCPRGCPRRLHVDRDQRERGRQDPLHQMLLLQAGFVQQVEALRVLGSAASGSTASRQVARLYQVPNRTTLFLHLLLAS